MPIPVGFEEISLWLAITAIIIMITSELLSQYRGKKHVRINNNKLRTIGIATSLLFLTTVIIRLVASFI